MRSVFTRAAAAAILAFVAAPLAAQQQSNPIESRLEARKVVVAADGKESFAPADAAKPGDLIEYTATYRNAGRAPVRQLEATLPVPANTELVAGSMRPGGAKVSLDGRTFADAPLKRVARRDGKTVEETVPTRELRYLRWYPGELLPDKSVSFSARVKVVDDRPGTGEVRK